MKNLLLLVLLIFTSLNVHSADRTVWGEIFTSQKANQDVSVLATGTGDVILGTFSGVLRATSGVLSTGSVDLTSDVTGTLPIGNGGTNSATALSNNFVMQSVGGAIVESLTTTQELGFLNSVTQDIQTALDAAALLPVDLTSDVTATLPIDSGGTNSTVALADDLVMQSVSGAIVESLTTTQELGYLNSVTQDVQEQFDELKALGFSGLRDGGALSIGAPNTTFSISDGFGYVVDNTTNPAIPLYTKVTWTGLTNIAVTSFAGTFTSVAINSAGTVIQKSATDFTTSEFRDYIILGRIVHPNLTTVTNVGGSIHSNINPGLNTYDLGHAIGIIKSSGAVITANGANLNLDMSTGQFLSVGSNFQTDPKNPNVLTTVGATVASWFYTYRDGSGGQTLIATQTLIDPIQYDDGTGTLAAVPNNRWTIHRLYCFPSSGNISVSYGQELFTNLTAAASSINNSSFVEPEFDTSILTGYIIVRGTATDLTDITVAVIIQAGKFGEGTTSGTASTTTNFQSTYENSTAPQIVLDSTRNGFEIEDAVTPIAVPLFSVQTTGATGDIVEITAETVSIKVPLAIETNIIFSQIATPSTPTTNKNKLYVKSDDKLYILDDAGTETEIGTGAGGGSASGNLDVFLTEDFETTVATDLTTGQNATFDNGGTIGGVVSDETSSPIAGLSSLKYVTHVTATNSNNDFFYLPAITLEDKQKGRDVGITFDYTWDGTKDLIQVIIYDDTGSLVLTETLDVIKNKGSPGGYFTNVIVPSTSTSLKVGFHHTGVSESSKTLVVEDIELTVKPYKFGSINHITKWESYTPVYGSGFGTVTNKLGKWRRVGSQMEIVISGTSGTAAASLAFVSLPSDYTINATDLTFNNTTSSEGDIAGVFNTDATSAGGIVTPVTAPATDATLVYFGANDAAATSHIAPANGTSIIGNSIAFSTRITIPIAGWSATSEMATAPGKVATENFIITQQNNFWDATGDTDEWDHSLASPAFSTSNLITVADVSGQTRIAATRKVKIYISFDGYPDATSRLLLQDSSANILTEQIATNAGDVISNSYEIVLDKDEYFYIRQTITNSNRQGALSITATPLEVIVLAFVPIPTSAYIDVHVSTYLDSVAATTAYKIIPMVAVTGDTSFLSINTNRVLLEAGRYDVIVPVAAFNGPANLSLLAYNYTDTVNIEEFITVSYSTSVNTIALSDVSMTITVTKPTEIEFQTKSSTASGSEYWGRIKITRIRGNE